MDTSPSIGERQIVQETSAQTPVLTPALTPVLTPALTPSLTPTLTQTLNQSLPTVQTPSLTPVPAVTSISYLGHMGLQPNPMTPVSLPGVNPSQLQLEQSAPVHLHSNMDGVEDNNDDPGKLSLPWNQYSGGALSNIPPHHGEIGGLLSGYPQTSYPQIPNGMPHLLPPHHPGGQLPPPHFPHHQLPPHMTPQHRTPIEPAYHTTEFTSADSLQLHLQPVPQLNSMPPLSNGMVPNGIPVSSNGDMNGGSPTSSGAPPTPQLALPGQRYTPFYSTDQYSIPMNGFHGGASNPSSLPVIGGLPGMVVGGSGQMGGGCHMPGQMIPPLGGSMVPMIPGGMPGTTPTAGDYLQTLPPVQKYENEQGYSSESDSGNQLSAG